MARRRLLLLSWSPSVRHILNQCPYSAPSLRHQQVMKQKVLRTSILILKRRSAPQQAETPGERV